MPSYKNGYIPKELLIVFASGTNSTIGYWEHSLSPASYARHLALVKKAKDRTGRTLALGAGWSAYRPYEQQVKARALYGNGAALPGTSSHGGFWEGQQTLAMDYSNWGVVYGWDQNAFFADCRAVGLTPGMIMRSRGYPDEPWHVNDMNPWSATPAGGNTTPLPTDTTRPQPEEEDEDMKMKGAFYTRTADKAVVYLLFNEISGFYVEHTGVTGTYNNDIAARWETNSWAGITESHAKVLKAALDKTRTRG